MWREEPRVVALVLLAGSAVVLVTGFVKSRCG
jgi:hypothetical protein